MVDVTLLLSQVSYVLGALGGVLVFVEFFQTPSYLSYNAEWDNWSVEMSPLDAREYTWAGRVGALLIALAFTLQFVATLF